MIIGVATVELSIPSNLSLKGKRSVVKSLLARLQREFKISAAEVDANDAWQRAVIGLACVSNSTDQAHRVLTRAIRAMESWRLDADVVDYHIEML
ncbi:MAG TPA: DUF503 domain-containing protein [Anaerolineae bacterium]|jgi:uncharacterized protein YlxP (DUF503 family)|nr:DUF503 domain-containing protein [Anaerolineae bacterium]